MGRLIKMEWNCPFCETKGIGGSLRNCPNCGHPIGTDIKYNLPNDVTKNYVPAEEAQRINRNPHWRCNFCNSYNSDNEVACISCGALRTNDSKNYFEVQEEKVEKLNSSTYSDSLYGNSSYSSSTSTTNSISLKNRIKKSANLFSRINWHIMIVVLLFILASSVIVYALIPKEKTMQVTNLSWERSIAIEQCKTVDESGWSLPFGARLHYTREELSGYKQVIDHYETKTRTVSKEVIDGYEEVVTGYKDLGNGYAEEITSKVPIYRTEYYEEEYKDPVYVSIPVYETKYYYEIDKWFYSRSVETSGTTDTPYWGEVTLAYNERIDSQTEHYYVTGLIKEKKKTFTFSFEDWSSISIGDEIHFNATLGHGKLIKEDSN